jgi:hypothetical protein
MMECIMPQADSAHSTTAPDDRATLSRRRVLGRLASSAAAGAVLTTHGLAADASPSPNDEWDGDAELLSLKPAFDELFDRLARQWNAEEARHRDWAAFLRSETGGPLIDWRDPGHRAAWDRAAQRFNKSREHLCTDEAQRELDELVAAVGESADEILGYFPTTLDGLRLQVRALMAVDYDVIWSPRLLAEEPENPRTAAFFEGLCDFLGVPFPPVPTGEEVRT